jgi:hypothetical protein
MVSSEYALVNAIKNAKSSRAIKYDAIDLVTNIYDPAILAREAVIAGINHKVGYLADVAAQAAEHKGLPEAASKLYSLAEKLYQTAQKGWSFLNDSSPEFAKRILASSPLSELNKKWKIYSTLSPKDLEDWIDLYVTKGYAATSRR